MSEIVASSESVCAELGIIAKKIPNKLIINMFLGCI